MDKQQLIDLLASSKDGDAEQFDAAALSDLLSSSLSKEARERLLDELADSEQTVGELRLLLSLEPATSAFSEAVVSASQVDSVSRRSVPWTPLAAAASILMAIGVAWVLMIDIPPGHEIPMGVQMRGEQSGTLPPHRSTLERPPDNLGWPATSESLTRLRLMDDGAVTIWLSTPSEASSIELPPSLLAAGRTYFWQIEDERGAILAGPYWFRIR